MPPRDGELLAAVDLGSNSFHLLLARRRGAGTETVLHWRDSVRLAAGLRADGTLDASHHDAAMTTLARYAAALDGVAPGCVAAAATAAVRSLADPAAFLRDASRALGHPVQLVSGEAEAALIWRGAEHVLPAHAAPRLVVDIGGASTEIIVGVGATPRHLHSVAMGCVVTPRELWPDGVLDAAAWQRATATLLDLLQPVVAPFAAIGWHDAWAGAGAAATIGAMAQAAGHAADCVDAAILDELVRRILACGHVARLAAVPGLDAEHAPIAAGGLLVMTTVLHAFGISRLRLRDFAMRDGLLQSLLTASAPAASGVGARA